MNQDAPFRRLLKFSAIILAIGTLLFLVCYFFIDRPLAEFVYHQKLGRFTFMKWFTYPPPVVETWAPLVMTLLIVRMAVSSKWNKWERTLFLSLLSLILADQFRESLQTLFGRDWPETWIDNNPSLIGSGAYGFHWFKGSEVFGSFPSGHAARTVAFFAVWWIAFPAGKWNYMLLSLMVCSGLIAMNYHFLGDVWAGVVLGLLVGMWTMRLAASCTSSLEVEAPVKEEA